MLSPFFGEIGISPFHAEMSFQGCSYACGYCFARLAGDSKQFKLASVLNSLKRVHDERPKGFVHQIVRDGFPILLSNKTDPCAKGNIEITKVIASIARDSGINLAFQTKGAEDALKISEVYGKPAFWYMTISSDNGYEKEWEPGAPSCEERISAAEELSKRGNFVMVGINPYVNEWIDDKHGLIARLKNAGVQALWVEPLHLNYRQRNAMPEKLKAKNPEIVKRAMRLNQSDALSEISELLNYAESIGIPGHHACRLSGAWEKLRSSKIYDKLFPTWHEFFNRYHTVNGEIPLVSWTRFEEYFDECMKDYQIESSVFQHYFFNRNRRKSEENHYRKGTIRELFKLGWDDVAGKQAHSPTLIDRIAYLTDEKNIFTGEDESPLIAVFEEPTETNIVTISEVE